MSEKKLPTPLKAIRQKCLDCCCYEKKEVRLCAAVNCPLHPYRFGHRPTSEKAAASGERKGV